jgi:hypothetical protein
MTTAKVLLAHNLISHLNPAAKYVTSRNSNTAETRKCSRDQDVQITITTQEVVT